MAKLPASSYSTLQRIDVKEIINSKPRGYMGMSAIGGDCPRSSWYSFRWTRLDSSHTARTERIFQVGHYYEDCMIKDLESIGIEHFGSQDEFTDITGHLKGHCDGRLLNVPEAPKTEHIFEAKTHNEKSFKDVVKKGVRESKPTHFGQCQIYMKYSKLKRALYMAYNKNTSEYYIERIEYDVGYADDLERRAHSIIFSEFPPEAPFKKTWFKCKWCNYYDICHNFDKDISPTCRTCEHVDLLNEGKWACSFHETELTYENQLSGCSDRKSII